MTGQEVALCVDRSLGQRVVGGQRCNEFPG